MKKQDGKQADTTMQMEGYCIVSIKQPYKCPVCGGSGKVPGGFYNGTGYIDEYGNQPWTGGYNTEACRACGGTGIIWG